MYYIQKLCCLGYWGDWLFLQGMSAAEAKEAFLPYLFDENYRLIHRQEEVIAVGYTKVETIQTTEV